MAKTLQLNTRVDPEKIRPKLQELDRMGFNQTRSVAAGIVMFYEFAKSNPAEAALLALRA